MRLLTLEVYTTCARLTPVEYERRSIWAMMLVRPKESHAAFRKSRPIQSQDRYGYPF